MYASTTRSTEPPTACKTVSRSALPMLLAMPLAGVQDSIVETWRNGDALIPKSWIRVPVDD